MSKRMGVVRVLAAIVCGAWGAAAQDTQAARFPFPPTGAEATDSARVAWLNAYGGRATGRLVDIWYSPGTLSPQHARALADSLDVAVDALVKWMGGTQSWQRIKSDRLRYYFPADRFVAHLKWPRDTLDAAPLMISAARVQVGPAPYLHETVHALLMPAAPFFPEEYPDSTTRERMDRRWPQWLVEGFAEFAAFEVAAATKFPEGDVWRHGGVAGLDTACAARAAGPRGAESVRRVGTGGYLPALFGNDRREVAPTFYACSASFSKFLTRRTDPPFMASLFREMGRVDETVARRTGKSLQELRLDWLRSIGHQP
jgi:hypothetical protein